MRPVSWQIHGTAGRLHALAFPHCGAFPLLLPSPFSCLPFFLARFRWTGVNSKVAEAGGLRKLLFDFGYSRKIGRLQAGTPLAHAAPIADLLVFSKVCLQYTRKGDPGGQ